MRARCPEGLSLAPRESVREELEGASPGRGSGAGLKVKVRGLRKLQRVGVCEARGHEDPRSARSELGGLPMWVGGIAREKWTKD